MSIVDISPLSKFDKIFVDRGDGTKVASFDDVRNPDNKDMPLPGLKRWCEMNKKNKRIVLETTETYAYTKMWLRGNGDIDVSEVRVLKKPEPVVETVVEKKVMPNPEPLVLKEPVAPVDKVKLSRQRTSERMKAFHAKRRAEKAKKLNKEQSDEKSA